MPLHTGHSTPADATGCHNPQQPLPTPRHATPAQTQLTNTPHSVHPKPRNVYYAANTSLLTSPLSPPTTTRQSRPKAQTQKTQNQENPNPNLLIFFTRLSFWPFTAFLASNRHPLPPILLVLCRFKPIWKILAMAK